MLPHLRLSFPFSEKLIRLLRFSDGCISYIMQIDTIYHVLLASMPAPFAALHELFFHSSKLDPSLTLTLSMYLFLFTFKLAFSGPSMISLFRVKLATLS